MLGSNIFLNVLYAFRPYIPPVLLQANAKRPITCEACSVECANASMYADHLGGKRHRCAAFHLRVLKHNKSCVSAAAVHFHRASR